MTLTKHLVAAALALAAVLSPALSQEADEPQEPDGREEELAVLDGMKISDLPMSFRLKDMTLRTIFDLLTDTAGVSLVYGDDFPFDRKISVNLEDVTFSQALKRLARQQRLRYELREDEVLYVDALE